MPQSEIINKLREFEKQLTDSIQVRRYDFSDESSKHGLKKIIDREFAERIRSYREIDRRGDVPYRNDWSDPVLARRKQAVLSTAIEADGLFGKDHPDICVADEVARICAPCAALTFDSLNREYYIELAAAIWLLDHLTGHDLYEQAVALFPQAPEQLKTVYLPNLTDATHSDDALRAMIYIIRGRNRGVRGYDESKSFIDEAEAARGTESETQCEPTADRKAFDGIIAMLGDEAVGELKERFVSLTREITADILRELSDNRVKLTQVREQMLGEVRLQLSLYEKAGKAELMPTVPVGDGADIVPDELPQLVGSIGKMNELSAKRDYLESEAERVRRSVMMADRQSDTYKISDPYGICLAFVLLLDENSDRAWEYNLCYSAVSRACRALPWAGSGAVDPDSDRDELEIDYDYLGSLAAERPDWDDDNTNELLYSKSVRSPLVSPEESRMSLAQLTFLVSGLIPPRRNDLLLFTKILLSDTDMSDREAEAWHAYFMLAYAAANREAGYTVEEAAPAAQEDSAAPDSAADDLRELKREIKRLRRLVNQLEHRNKECAEELAVKDSRLSAAVTELSELRTMIRESVSADVEAPVTVSFPYASTRRALIFGGHESWVKAIRPLLDNVRFISASEQPNAGVIMNAEVVWFQTNALGHSSYYKIIDVVRRHDIKVRYFKYASAEKCAEQFALEDMDESL